MIQIASKKIFYTFYDKVSCDLGQVATASTIQAVRRDCAMLLKREPVASNPDDYALIILGSIDRDTTPDSWMQFKAYDFKVFAETGEFKEVQFDE